MSFLTTSFGIVGILVIVLAALVIGGIYLFRRPKVLQIKRDLATGSPVGVDQEPSVRDKDRANLNIVERIARLGTRRFVPRQLGNNQRKRISRQRVVIRMPNGRPYLITAHGRALPVHVTSNGDMPMQARQINEHGLIHGRHFVPERIAIM